MFKEFSRRFFLKSIATPALVVVSGVKIKLPELKEDKKEEITRTPIKEEHKLLEPGEYTLKIVDVDMVESRKLGEHLIRFQLEEQESKTRLFQYFKAESEHSAMFMLAFMQKFDRFAIPKDETVDLTSYVGREARLRIEVEKFADRKFNRIR